MSLVRRRSTRIPHIQEIPSGTPGADTLSANPFVIRRDRQLHARRHARPP